MSKIRKRAHARRLAAANWAVIALRAQWLAKRHKRPSSRAPAPTHGAGATRTLRLQPAGREAVATLDSAGGQLAA